MLRKIKNYLYAIILCFSALGASTVHAQTSSYEELQAAYIFNFAKYVAWRPTQSPTFVVGVYGELEIMEFLEKAFYQKKIGGKTAELKIIKTAADMLTCNILYLPGSGSKNIKEVTLETKGKNILIVTEEDLIKKGAAISFVVEDDRLKFKMKPAALSEAGLSASEGLLKLAIVQ
jgi:hypothetical protein